MKDDTPLTLHLAAPTVAGFAALYRALTGKDMSDAGKAKLREALEETETT